MKAYKPEKLVATACDHLLGFALLHLQPFPESRVQWDAYREKVFRQMRQEHTAGRMCSTFVMPSNGIYSMVCSSKVSYI